MTVCIAAIAQHKDTEYIVAASDKMLSTQEFSADDVAVKSHMIAEEWGLMWAAEDISHITPIWAGAQALLYEDRLHVHLPDVARAVAMSYQRQIREEGTAKHLSRYGLSMADFLKRGASLFPAAQYEEMHREIRATRLGCEFLGFGFDDRAHIFRVSEPGKISYEDEAGFAAIGSGWYSAISTLFFHRVNNTMELWEVVYHVLEAKFMAESAPGVGADTWAVILDSDGNYSWIFDPCIEFVRAMWRKSGMPRVPKSAEDKISVMIRDCKRESAKLDKMFKKDLAKQNEKMRVRGDAIREQQKEMSEKSAKAAGGADGTSK